MTSLALFITERLKAEFYLRRIAGHQFALEEEITAVIASAIAEHDKATPLCVHCGKTSGEHHLPNHPTAWHRCPSEGASGWSVDRVFTPADPTKEKQ